jgi:Cys-Gly metallodipeptidase DUG1
VSKLVSPEGKILIPGVNDLIAPVTDDERKKFEEIHFKITDIQGAIGGDQTLSDDPVATLMGRMSKLEVSQTAKTDETGNPSLSLHGIEGAFCKFKRSNWSRTDE